MTILKEHVSYSEIRQWKECPWRHKLLYIDKLSTFEESPHLHYGTILHDACEHFLKTRELKIEEAKQKIIEAWNEHGFDSEDFIVLQTARAKLQGWNYKHNKLNDWLQWAEASLLSVPDFMEENFPNWEVVAAEEALYEAINGHDTKFKGYIDCIIKIPYKDEYKYWILDWKTSSGRGWSLDKQRDFNVQAQVILYKDYWSTKNNIKPRNVQCGFILLKKVKTAGKSCQLIKVSSGPKTIEKSQKLVSSMINTVKKGMYLKNKESCMFCEFKGTEYCK